VTNAQIKARLKAGTPVLGTWLSIPSTDIVEILCGAGIDFLTVDMEHSAITLTQAHELMRVASLMNVAPLVRLPSNDATLIKRVLDCGAAGIIIPMVNSAAEAAAAVAAVRYPPAGRRSVGIARAQGYGPGFDDYVKRANRDLLVIPQIEHVHAVDNIDAILSVEGIDAFIIGPYDLSASLNLTGNLGHRRVQAALDRVLDAGRRHRVPAGFHFVDPEVEPFVNRVREGFLMAAYSVDFLLIGKTFRRDITAIRQQVAGSRPRARKRR
jgi:2-keto-3-deoxy-L-rhamnonate aldolase RhmA